MLRFSHVGRTGLGTTLIQEGRQQGLSSHRLSSLRPGATRGLRAPPGLRHAGAVPQRNRRLHIIMCARTYADAREDTARTRVLTSALTRVQEGRQRMMRAHVEAGLRYQRVTNGSARRGGTLVIEQQTSQRNRSPRPGCGPCVPARISC